MFNLSLGHLERGERAGELAVVLDEMHVVAQWRVVLLEIGVEREQRFVFICEESLFTSFFSGCVFSCLGGGFSLLLFLFGRSAFRFVLLASVFSPRFTVLFFPGLVVFFGLFLLRLVLDLFVLSHFFGQVALESLSGLLSKSLGGQLFGLVDVLGLDLQSGLVPEAGLEVLSAGAGVVGGNTLHLARFARGAGVELRVVAGVGEAGAFDVARVVPLVDFGDVLVTVAA